jgi:titin
MTNRTSIPVPPQAPADLIAVAVGDIQVILAWTECGADGIGFHIERAEGIGFACLFSEVGTTRAHIAAFRDESVKPRTTYSYRVHAWNAAGDSSLSNVAVVTTHEDETELLADKE